MVQRIWNITEASEQTIFITKDVHNLSREHSTVMTVVPSKKELKPPPLEFVFRRQGAKGDAQPS